MQPQSCTVLSMGRAQESRQEMQGMHAQALLLPLCIGQKHNQCCPPDDCSDHPTGCTNHLISCKAQQQCLHAAHEQPTKDTWRTCRMKHNPACTVESWLRRQLSRRCCHHSTGLAEHFKSTTAYQPLLELPHNSLHPQTHTHTH
jgi:hypothetical protein